MERLVDNEYPTVDEFWEGIEDVLSTECSDHDAIDDCLRSYLEILDKHYQDYITTEDHLGHCAYLLYASQLYAQNASYIRQQLIYCLLQDDEITHLRIVVTFLLADAREDEQTFDLLNKEGVFPRLIALIAHPREDEESLHRTLMELLYELARIQKITNDDLSCVDDAFVYGLFDIIEQASDDVNDPYHYPVIRVLLVMNEQFMVAAHDPAVLSKQSMPLTNKVVKVLSSYGSRYKTFGANIILLLNREDETSLQLLTLKLMYLLFTTPPTYEYFYTNDLRVLVDILIRNLLDLPEYASALRHTYLRVLYPLLEHTQLQYPPYYKRQDIRKLLALLCGEQVELDEGSPPGRSISNHFEDVDDTTKRLVKRCQGVSWLSDPDTELVRMHSPTSEGTPEPDSPRSSKKPPELPAPRKLRKRDSSKASTLTIRGFLTPQLEGARQSSISMAEIAQQKEKPGVITPSRNPSFKHGLRQAIFTKKEKPPPPKARRSGFMRPKPHPAQTDSSSAMSEMAVTTAGTSTSVSPFLEGDEFEDALETQVKNETLSETPEQTPETTNPESEEPETNTTSLSKKPPPAPKARRGWRMRSKSKSQETTELVPNKEPGKFSAELPSIITTSEHNPVPQVIEKVPTESPFSPVKDKTLDPMPDVASSTAHETMVQKRSVSDALNQAQEQAVQQVEECLEHTHIADESRGKMGYPRRTSSLQPIPERPVVTSRLVLAPPGQAPVRGVPGPRVDLEKSPFLSDDEEVPDHGQVVDDSVADEEARIDDERPPIVASVEDPPLRTKESWEDFEEHERE